MTMTDIRYPTPAEIRAAEIRAHKMRAEAMREMVGAAGKRISHFFAGFNRHAHG